MDNVLQRLAVELALDSREFATGSTDVQRRAASLRDSILGLGDSWMRAGKRMSIGITAPLTGFGILSAKAASDAEELESAFGQTFGKLTPMMDRWARETGDAMGRSTQAMQNMANTFGIFFNQAAPTRKEAAEMSKTFSVLAQDLASFFNVSEDTALQKLRSGLSGEAEPLRDFGVFLNAAAVEAKGLEMGLGGLTGELSEQEKILARYQLILESTGDAQGDVARTQDSAANSWRAFTSAIDELQVVIGERLLPVLTPLINAATNLVNGFNNLPSPVQTVIVAFGALAAAIGPMMLVMGTLAATILPLFAAKFGPIGLAISAFINPLGTAIGLLGQFALSLAGMTALKTIGALLLRFMGPIGLLVTAGTLIYQNWDAIVEVFGRFKARASEAIGPPLQRLVTTLQGIFEKFWNDPMGDGVRMAMDLLAEFGAVAGEWLGDRLIAILSALGELVIGAFEQIGRMIDLVNALLNGDWAAAWRFANDIVVNMMTGIINAIDTMTGGALTNLANLVQGVRDWIGQKLNAIWQGAIDKINAVERAFFNLYDAVVGNSHVPDMVDGIAAEMARLDQVMVAPAQRAAQTTEETMRALASRVKRHLDDLFPEIERAAAQSARIADLFAAERGGLISKDTRREAVRRSQGFDEGPLVDIKKMGEAADRLIEQITGAADKTKVQTVRIAQSVGDMARDSIRSLEGMVNAIKGGGWLDILGSAVDLFLQLASTGLFGDGLAKTVNSSPRIPGFARGTNFAPGGLAVVGEMGPELVNLPRGSQVIPNNELRRARPAGGVVNNYYTLPSDEFWANVDSRADNRVGVAMPTIARAGSRQSAVDSQKAAQRRVRR